MHNYQTCGGPKSCHYCWHILTDETPEEACARWQHENRELAELRAAMRRCDNKESTMTKSAPPEPYAEGLAKLRAAQGITLNTIEDDDPRLTAMAQFRTGLYEQARLAALQAPPATSKAHLEPPDGYAIAIKRMKERR